MDTTYFNSQHAADYLNLSKRRIQTLIKNGRIPATKFGRDWMICANDLKAFAKQPRRVGYPKGRARK